MSMKTLNRATRVITSKIPVAGANLKTVIPAEAGIQEPCDGSLPRHFRSLVVLV